MNPTFKNYLSELETLSPAKINAIFFNNDFSEEIWSTTYKDHADKHVLDTWKRIAWDIASVEATEELRWEWYPLFLDMLLDFKGVPGGRIQSNAGTEWKSTTYFNCFVGPQPESDLDSLESIYKALTYQAHTLKSEGGYGMSFNFLRPRGALIHGVGVESPGAVKFMELWDKSSEIVTSGSGLDRKSSKAKGKIRKGAQMASLNIAHPDIIEFITAKQTPGRLTKFNVSVELPDSFVEKVNKITELMKEGAPEEEILKYDQWDLIYPDTTHSEYKEYWKGSFEDWLSRQLPVIIYETTSVRRIWNLIMESTYSRNEPGVLFLERANKLNPARAAEELISTNPCVTGDTLILTRQGYVRIDSVVDQEVEVWNGYEWSWVTPQVTGTNQELMHLKFSDGSELTCTHYHKFILNNEDRVEAKDLSLNSKLIKHSFPVIEGEEDLPYAYTMGFYSGDGTTGANTIFLYGPKQDLLQYLAYDNYTVCDGNLGEPRTYVNLHCKNLDKNFVPTANHSIKSRLHWLAGILDSDGGVTDGCGQICSINLDFLNKIKFMLNTLGASGVISLCKPAELKLMPDGKGGQKEYQTQDLWRINISANYIQALIKLGLQTHRLDFSHIPQREASRFVRPISISYCEEIAEKVYCFNEPKNHSGIFNGVITAQCGEIPLPPGGICCLGTLNLTKFLNQDFTDFDYEKIAYYAKVMVRFLDNVNTRSDAPLPEYRWSKEHKRRIGAGIMGWGSALLMLKTRFGSEKASKLRDIVMKTFAQAVYEAGIDLAEEKGMYSVCVKEDVAETPFVKRLELSPYYMDKLRKVGIRFSAGLSSQPNGNTSIEAGIVTGGIEPMFMYEFVRTSIVSQVPEEIKALTPAFHQGVYEETDLFKWTKEGDEDILRGVGPSGTVYKIDRNRGLTKETLCEDYGVRFLKDRGEWDPTAEYVVTTTQLTAKEHVDDLSGFCYYIDNSASKTVNLPYDYSFEDFKDLYLYGYNTGNIKGLTTYRAGTMTSVLATKDEASASPEDEEIIQEDIHLSDSLPATLKTLRAEGRKWYLTLLMNEAQTRPVALFVQTNSAEKNVTTTDAVEKLTALATLKGIPAEHVGSVLKKIGGDPNTTKITRLISLCLRHGVLVRNVVAVLDQVDCIAGSFVFHIRKFLASLIKDGEKIQGETCSECGQAAIIYQEGCKVCSSCGNSKCG